MIVHVPVVRVLQSSVDEVIDVLAVGYRRVTAIRPVLVTRLGDGAKSRLALIWICRRDFDHVLDCSAAFLMEKAATLEIVDMPFMTNGDPSRSN